MKKVSTSLLLCLLFVLTFALSGCGDEDGTYYPDYLEMKANLEKCDYTVEISGNEYEHCGYTYLYAYDQNNEYIKFYWFDGASAVQHFEEILENENSNYDKLVSIQNDEIYGNLAFCGTENAVNAAGIKIVDVKVKV